jgi:hypothetical protein
VIQQRKCPAHGGHQPQSLTITHALIKTPTHAHALSYRVAGKCRDFEHAGDVEVGGKENVVESSREWLAAAERVVRVAALRCRREGASVGVRGSRNSKGATTNEDNDNNDNIQHHQQKQERQQQPPPTTTTATTANHSSINSEN